MAVHGGAAVGVAARSDARGGPWRGGGEVSADELADLRAQVDSDAALISALADAGGALAEALDATVLDGRHPVETARMATKLRAVMADV